MPDYSARPGFVLVLALAMGSASWGFGATLHVEDDAPNDPGPNDPAVSDPNEDGSADHPFDTIQEAIDAALTDDVVEVSTGTYYENITYNGKQIAVQSTDPNDWSVVEATTIDGDRNGAVVRLQEGQGPQTLLSGFTIRNGKANRGAGIYGGHSGATVSRCIIRDNRADTSGGVYRLNGVLSDCIVAGNSADTSGGGINLCDAAIVNCIVSGNENGGITYSTGPIVNCLIANNSTGIRDCPGTILNCTIVDSRYNGILLCQGAITNCIVWGNATTSGYQVDASTTPTYSCIQGWSGGGEGNISDEPQFYLPGDYHLDPNSPCIDAGTGVALDYDFDGNMRPLGGAHDMGMYEYDPAGQTLVVNPSELIVHAYEGDPNSPVVLLQLGNAGGGIMNWSLDDDVDWLRFNPEPPNGSSSGEVDTVDIWADLATLSHGRHDAVITINAPGAKLAPRTIPLTLYINTTLHVKQDGTGDFLVIQPAIDEAVNGDTIIAWPGVYNENVEFLGKEIVLRSADPMDASVVSRTVINASLYWGEAVVTFAGTEGPGAVLAGFTLTNGNRSNQLSGVAGGIRGRQTHATIMNCVLAANVAGWPDDPLHSSWGGGIEMCDGLIANCLVAGCVARNGAGIDDCQGTITNCTVVGNYGEYGAGLFDCHGTIRNSIVWNNASSQDRLQISDSVTPTYSCVEGWTGLGEGNIIIREPILAPPATGSWTADGQYDPNTYEVTLTDNTAVWDPDELVGKLVNPNTLQPLQCVVIGNTDTTVTVLADVDTIIYGSWVTAGANYAIYDYHLPSESPCINRGDPDADYTDQTDIDGDPRVIHGRVDIGADEYTGALPPSKPALVATDAPPNGTLPKTQNNVLSLTFDLPITLPGSDPVSIVELADPNNDVSSAFNYQIDPNDPNGQTLKATENGAQLANQTWYHVTPEAALNVHLFEVDVCTLTGDANDSGRVTTADYSSVKAALGQREGVRADLNGSGRVTTADYSVVKAHLGEQTPAKP